MHKKEILTIMLTYSFSVIASEQPTDKIRLHSDDTTPEAEWLAQRSTGREKEPTVQELFQNTPKPICPEKTSTCLPNCKKPE